MKSQIFLSPAIHGVYRLFSFAVCLAVVFVGLLLTTNGRAQNLFVSDLVRGDIYEYTPDGARSTFASGLQNPAALTFDSAGDLFVATDALGTNQSILSITPDGSESIFAGGLAEPRALAFDSAGDLFVANTGGENIIEIAADGTQTTFASGLDLPYGMAFQPAPELQGVATNGVFQLCVSLPPAYFYSTSVMVSSNLVNWTAIYTNTPPYMFTDSVASGGFRFYRAALVPMGMK